MVRLYRRNALKPIKMLWSTFFEPTGKITAGLAQKHFYDRNWFPEASVNRSTDQTQRRRPVVKNKTVNLSYLELWSIETMTKQRSGFAFLMVQRATNWRPEFFQVVESSWNLFSFTTKYHKNGLLRWFETAIAQTRSISCKPCRTERRFSTLIWKRIWVTRL